MHRQDPPNIVFVEYLRKTTPKELQFLKIISQDKGFYSTLQWVCLSGLLCCFLNFPCSLTLTALIEVDIEYGEKKKKRFFHPIVGRIWYSLLYFFAAGATFATALGCWSPATKELSLINTDTRSIINYLVNATSLNETQFQHPDLPDFWSWGFSGTCQLYIDPSREIKCYHAFPPLFTIQDLVEKALSSSNQPDTAATIATWKSALSMKPSDPAFSVLANSDSQKTHSVSLFRGAAAAMIFSLLISLNNCFSSLTLFFLPMDEESKRKYRFILLCIAIFDFLLCSAALVCFTYAMIVGPGALDSGGWFTNGLLSEVGLIVILASVICRLISVPIIGFVFVCLLGSELLLIIFVGYVMWKFLEKLVDGHEFG